MLGLIAFSACKDDNNNTDQTKSDTTVADKYTLDEVAAMLPGIYLDSINLEQRMYYATYEYASDKTAKAIVYSIEGDTVMQSNPIQATWKMLDVNVANEDTVQYYTVSTTFDFTTFVDDPVIIDSLRLNGFEMTETDTVIVAISKSGRMGLLTLESLQAQGKTDIKYMSQLIELKETRGLWDIVKSACDWVVKTTKEKINTFGRTIGGIFNGDKYNVSPVYYDWMKHIHDSIPVCDISIPGTHDSFSQGVSILVSAWAQTQVFDLDGLWNRGCRYFDIRPGYDDSFEGDKILRVVHGSNFIYCYITVKDALNKIANKLKENPTETAVVVLSFDAFGGQYDAAKKMLTEIVDAIDDSRVADWTPSIRMGEARGRMILISRDGSYSTKKHIAVASDWGKNNGSLKYGNLKASLCVQDNSEMSASETVDTWVTRKETSIKDCFEIKAKNLQDTYEWTFNHTSGFTRLSLSNFWTTLLIPSGWITLATAAMSYSENAKFINPWFNDYIEQHPGYYTGIIPMDFYGTEQTFCTFMTNTKDLPLTIINHNKTLTWHNIPFWKD